VNTFRFIGLYLSAGYLKAILSGRTRHVKAPSRATR
jgi:hypothetical protein